MPKDVIAEGLIDKFLLKVFQSVLKGKQRAVLKAVDKDPELKKLTKRAQDSLEDLHKHAKFKVLGVGRHLPGN
jgi:hypothetical protein